MLPAPHSFLSLFCMLCLLPAMLLTQPATAEEILKSEYTHYWEDRAFAAESVKRIASGDGSVVEFQSTLCRPYQVTPVWEYLSVVMDRASGFIHSYHRRRTLRDRHPKCSLEWVGDRYRFLRDQSPFPPLLLWFETDSHSLLPYDIESACLMNVITDHIHRSPAPAGTFSWFNGFAVAEASYHRVNEAFGQEEYQVDLATPYQIRILTENGLLVELKSRQQPYRISRVERAAELPAPIAAPFPAETVRKTIRFQGSDQAVINGELLLPGAATTYPVIVLVGDPVLDRYDDGVFPGITAACVGHGIGVFLFDQRGSGASSGILAQSPVEMLVEDIEAAFHQLKQSPGVDAARIVLLGHYRGGNLAIAAAARNPNLRGCLLISTPAARWFPDLQILQLQNKEEEKFAESVSNIENIRNLVKDESGDWMLQNGRPFPIPFLRSTISWDPIRPLTEIRMPVSILHGKKDARVPESHAEALKAYLVRNGNPDVELHIYPHLGQDLGKRFADRDAPPETAGVRPDPRVLRDLLRWLDRILAG